MDLSGLERNLEQALAGPLPGPAGQLPLAPRPRFGWKAGRWPDDCRHGGALLLLYPYLDEPHLLLTLRDAAMQHHAGQVSLPGGAVEPGESYEQAALREAHEEVGVKIDSVRVVGALTPLHVPVSRFVVHPSVGVSDSRPCLRPKRGEVARVLEVALARLRDPVVIGVERRSFEQREVDVPFFAVDGEKVWGATAMVLAEFLTVLGTRPDPWS